MSFLKPVNICCDKNVTETMRSAAVEAVRLVLAEIAHPDIMPVRDFGYWLTEKALDGNRLVEYQSTEWYIRQAGRSPRGQVYTGPIIEAFFREPWQRSLPHYDILLIADDAHPRPGHRLNYIIGEAEPGLGCVVSYFRFADYRAPDLDPEDLFMTSVMHEFGHVLGLVPDGRTNVAENLGPHCTNACIMRQEANPHRWDILTRDRLERGPFCPQCLNYLRHCYRTASAA